MINIGFIGLGGMGMHQVRAFAKLRRCRIAAGSDVAPKGRKTFATQFPKAAVYKDHKQLLKDNNVDAVLIATPTGFHKAVAVDVLRAGRDVLTEKPMAMNTVDCRRMIDVADKTGRLLMVAQCRRYDTDWGTFAKVYRAGKLGSPVLWRHCMAGNRPPTPWFMDAKLGGGPMIDGAVHNQDFAVMLFGKPTEVVVSSIKLTKHTAVDTASAVIHYENGCQLLLSWSWGIARGDAMHDVLGPKATLTFPGDGYHLTSNRTHKRTKVPFKESDMYVTQAKHFIDCIERGIACQSPGTESIKSIASAEAVLKVARKGRGTQKVSW